MNDTEKDLEWIENLKIKIPEFSIHKLYFAICYSNELKNHIQIKNRILIY